MEIRGIDWSTVREGKSVIVNQDEMATHADRCGTPDDHSEINAFLGVPLIHKEKTVGMVGLGNKEGGYELADQEAGMTPVADDPLMERRSVKDEE